MPFLRQGAADPGVFDFRFARSQCAVAAFPGLLPVLRRRGPLPWIVPGDEFQLAWCGKRDNDYASLWGGFSSPPYTKALSRQCAGLHALDIESSEA